MDILRDLPRSKSGYYWVKIGEKDAQVYCDMENYGMQTYFYQERHVNCFCGSTQIQFVFSVTFSVLTVTCNKTYVFLSFDE